MQIQIHDHKETHVLFKISGVDVTALYDTRIFMNCVLYACYTKLYKDPLSLKTLPSRSVHSATGHSLCPKDLHVMNYNQ